ncbi:MAG: AGE family epimerase/isomerase, partial [Vicinamibacterales bacterium]
LFDRRFDDPDKGGYFSHIDPISLDPRDPSLTHNQARKNWNSVGDHAPAFLINLYLATGDERWARMLAYVADAIATHMPDYDNSPFMQEKFFEDWSPDHDTPLQKNRGLVGHNMKVAWTLTRVYHLNRNDRYVWVAKKIAEEMPKWGFDNQRGGIYDMVDRQREPGEEFHRLVWHDRKAWWQQEQAILAYLIMAGSFGDHEYVRLARETAAFYNAFFPDKDSGAVYFNVLATGVPYLLDTERLKGSHSMSGYHSFELCYLAAVYGNLLVTRQPMDLYFKPKAGALPGSILRIAPDLLPKGSVRIGEVWVDGQRHTDFDPEGMTVTLPEPLQSHPLQFRPAHMGNPRPHPATSDGAVSVRVRLVPGDHAYDIFIETNAEATVLTLAGELSEADEPALRAQMDKIIASRPSRLVIRVEDLESIALRPARAIAFLCQKLSLDESVYVAGANDDVQRVFAEVGFWEEITPLDDYERGMFSDG